MSNEKKKSIYNNYPDSSRRKLRLHRLDRRRKSSDTVERELNWLLDHTTNTECRKILEAANELIIEYQDKLTASINGPMELL